MKDGKGRPLFWGVFLIVLVNLFYFFIFPEPLSPQLSAAPRWFVKLKPTVITENLHGDDEPAIAFKTSSMQGYFNAEGHILRIIEGGSGIALSDKAYVTPAVNGGLLLSPDGKVIAKTNAPKLFFSGARLFSAESDGTGVSTYDGQGHFQWSYSFPCHLSAFATGDSLIVGGTIDGWVEGVSEQGKQLFNFAPGGSRLSMILGLGVSKSGGLVAVISGADRQRLVILGRGGNDYRVISHKYLDSDYREPVRVLVMEDDTHVLYRRPDGVGVWSVDGGVDAILPVMADDFDVSLDTSMDVAYLAVHRGIKSEILVFKRPATLLGRIPLPDSSDYIRFSGSSVFVGGDSWLARFDFLEG
jgi:hypothetical protein